jgi:exodeoxyribonuclease V gamma subunit
MLHIHYSNRLEQLFECLLSVLSEPLSQVFDSEKILVQSQGMARWLSLQIAHQQGVSANCQFPYPASYIWSLLTRQLQGLPEQSSFDKALLQWRIIQRLPQLLEEPAFEPLRHYLQDDTEGVKLYQLAGKVADIFDQYLVYRPDWIEAWEGAADDDGVTVNGDQQGQDDAGWQALLWRQLLADISNRNNLPEGVTRDWHRGRLAREFLALAREGSIDPRLLPERLAVFGISVLPPVYLEVFEAIAEHCDVHLFVLNPSIAYWGDLVTERQMARLRQQWRKKGLSDASDYYDSGNDLLASMGSQGQEYQTLLQSLNSEEHDAFVDVCSDPDAPEASLLALIQQDILQLENAYQYGRRTITAQQVNIRVHDCHSPMRELEVLHDQLLSLFAANPALQPHDIVVMVPDVDRYAPYIHAVFASRQGRHFIPFSVADRNGRQEHPIIEAFFQLLELAGSDFTVSDVCALLDVEALSKKFKFDDVDQLKRWIHKANVRWGLDQEQRQSSGTPTSINTWSFGIQRMLLGYLFGEHDEPVWLDDEPVAPLSIVEGQAALDVGNLAQFLASLKVIEGLSKAKDVYGWQTQLHAIVDTFFDAEADDQVLLQMIRDVVTELASQLEQAEFDQLIHFPVIKDYLLNNIGEKSQGQHFLSGQVNFCTLMPMRAIPFQVVALMGLNDSDYPRQQPRLGFDLMARDHRAGDRSRRDDDRYLFLEALLSARQHVHISYVGRSIRDNAEKQPSVLVSELLDYIGESFTLSLEANAAQAVSAENETEGESEGESEVKGKTEQVGQKALWAALLTRHPLQAFNPRYFSDDADVFSFASQWLPSARAMLSDKADRFQAQDLFAEPEPVSGFMAYKRDYALAVLSPKAQALMAEGPILEVSGLEVSGLDAQTRIEFDELKAFFEHPARFTLRKGFGIELTIDIQDQDDTERFALDGLQSYLHVTEGLTYRLLAFEQAEQLDGDDSHLQMPDQSTMLERFQTRLKAQGELPYGAFEVLARESLSQQIEGFSEHLFACDLQPGADLEIHLNLAPYQLVGWIHPVFRQGLVSWRYGKMNGARLLSCWLDHLAYSCQMGDGQMGDDQVSDGVQTAATSVHLARDGLYRLQAIEPEMAAVYLRQLLTIFVDAKEQLLPFFPRAAWTYVQQSQAEKTPGAVDVATLAVLQGSDFGGAHPELDEWYLYLLRDQSVYLDEAFRRLSEQVFMPLHQHLEIESF